MSIKKSRAAATALAGALAGCIVAGLHGCGGDDGPSGPPGPSASVVLSAVSTRAMMVSGGDVLVEASPPAALPEGPLTFLLNGADVTERFVAESGATRMRALLTGLPAGTNVLTAVSGGKELGKLEIKNFAASGPIFSGTRESPWICETEASGLGAAPAAGPCVASMRYDWFYRTTAGTFRPLTSLAKPYPADLAKTVTTEGKNVDYIVRVESGTINESIYRIAILDDPANPIREPWSKSGKRPGDGWNGKLTYPFVGGAAAGFRSGSNDVTSALQDLPLSLGFAVAFGTRNTYGTAFDDVTSSETTMMVKERFIEQYGVPKFTISSGGSGGSILQHYIVQNYPGLIDAITPGVAFSDITTLVVDVLDCKPLNRYFDTLSPDPASWSATRRAAVDGGSPSVFGPDAGKTLCQANWSGFSDRFQNPKKGFDGPGATPGVPPIALRYDAVLNPTGARGTIWDANVNTFGRDPATGFARSAYDNVGIQYGLKAVNTGAITPEEFVHLNEHVGGLDANGNATAQRTAGDIIAVRRAYQAGRVTHHFDNFKLPIIEWRIYSDMLADVHPRNKSLAFLDRLKKATGTTANQVNWTHSELSGIEPMERMALLGHNEWLEKIAADTSADSYAAKVIKNKPGHLKDACWIGGVKIEEPISWDPNTACNKAMPINLNVRTMAGGPLTEDIVMCTLKPVDFSSYSITFTPAQQQRLKAAFPRGVCDWSVPGQGQSPFLGPWLDFSSGLFGPANIHN